MMDSWKDWTPEQWRNAEFCQDCGLPLLEVEDEDPGIGHYMCVFCTWVEDIEDVHKSRIARLEAEVERLREAQRWIPVSEGLPEADKDYKCVSINVLMFDNNSACAIEGWYNFSDGEWHNYLTNEKFLQVTHWMPLPEPPEVE